MGQILRLVLWIIFGVFAGHLGFTFVTYEFWVFTIITLLIQISTALELER